MVIHFWLVQIVIQTNRVLRKLNSESEKERKKTPQLCRGMKKNQQSNQTIPMNSHLLNDKLIKIDMDAVR